MKSMIKATISLVIITLVSGALLGLVYELTKSPIAEQNENKKKAAFKEVFNDAADFAVAPDITAPADIAELAEQYPNETVSDEVICALDSAGNVLGYVLMVTTHEGYSGDITFSMGIRLDGTLNGISILKISETPGLGMKAKDILKPQFENKNVTEFGYTKTGSASPDQIDAISGATITTNAVTNGVNAGLLYFQLSF